ncbi:hypothetical protein HH297_17100, partial [Xanthomonas sp. Kuri4-3]
AETPAGTDADTDTAPLPDDATTESIQAFEMAQAADTFEHTGDEHIPAEARAAQADRDEGDEGGPASGRDDAARPAGSGDTAAFDLGPLDFGELDGELVDIFVEEGNDLLDHCDGLIAGLREQPDDREHLTGLQRDLHTLKGGARMAGINAIGDLGHGIESFLEAVAAGRTDLDRDDIHLLERGFDRLHQLLTRTGEHRAVAMPSDLVQAFDARTLGRGEAPSNDADLRARAQATVAPAP